MRWLSGFGINAHFLFCLTPLGRAKVEDLINPEEWEFLVEQIIKKMPQLSSKTDIICEIHHLKGEEKINIIEAGCRLDTKNHAVITAEGNVYPCSLFTSSDKSLGNVNNEDLFSIWQNSKMWNFYNRKNDDPDCENCDRFNKCKGGCRGYAFLFGKGIDKKDPRCSKTSYPVCLSWKLNIKDLKLACATWRVMRR